MPLTRLTGSAAAVHRHRRSDVVRLADIGDPLREVIFEPLPDAEPAAPGRPLEPATPASPDRELVPA